MRFECCDCGRATRHLHVRRQAAYTTPRVNGRRELTSQAGRVKRPELEGRVRIWLLPERRRARSVSRSQQETLRLVADTAAAPHSNSDTANWKHGHDPDPPADALRASYVQRFTTCGRPNCRCAAGDQHGPFYFLTQDDHLEHCSHLEPVAILAWLLTLVTGFGLVEWFARVLGKLWRQGTVVLQELAWHLNGAAERWEELEPRWSG